VSLVASNQGKVVPKGNGRDDGIGPTDGLAGVLQVGVDSPGQFGALHVQGQYIYGDYSVQELFYAILALYFMQALDNLQDSDRGDGVAAKDGAVSGGLGHDVGVNALEDFGENIGVEESFIQRAASEDRFHERS